MCPVGFKQRVASQFDARSSHYDLKGDYHRSLAQKIIEKANLKNGERVLDAACGTGILTCLAADLVGDEGLVLGIDLSLKMLNEVREYCFKSIFVLAKTVLSLLPLISDPFFIQAHAKLGTSHAVALICADLEAIDFPEGSFDAILCSSALVFMSDIPKIIQAWHRWLRQPTGRVIFNTPKAHAVAAFEIFASVGRALGAPSIEEPTAIFSSEEDVYTMLSSFSSVDIHTSFEGRTYPRVVDGAQEYATRMWDICSQSPFSPVDQLVCKNTAEAWKEAFLAETAAFASKELTDSNGDIHDGHEMFWVVAKY